MCWSGGKDSALALYEVLRDRRYEVTALLTTMTEGYDRISMHGVRKSLLHAQVESLNIPLCEVLISQGAGNEEYEAKMESALRKFFAQGVRAVCFGDIFLEDLRAYREKNLATLGMRGLFPLWKQDTTVLVERFIRSGFGALVACVDTRVLDPSFAGREINWEFLRMLPTQVDPCGENGEYHSFVFAGPIYKSPIPVKLGEAIKRDVHFCFRDMTLETEAPRAAALG